MDFGLRLGMQDESRMAVEPRGSRGRSSTTIGDAGDVDVKFGLDEAIQDG
jgi:hypothetical protein